MAEPCNNNQPSAPKDGAAVQPERYAHGSEVIAELRARVLGYKTEAVAVAAIHDTNEWHHSSSNFRGMAKAFDMILKELDELSGSDQKQCEGTKPNA